MARNGIKTGGRKKGTPNKKTLNFVESLGSYDPLESLLNIVKDENTPLETKIRINLDLLPYIYPKRKAIELRDKDCELPPIVIRCGDDEREFNI